MPNAWKRSGKSYIKCYEPGAKLVVVEAPLSLPCRRRGDSEESEYSEDDQPSVKRSRKKGGHSSRREEEIDDADDDEEGRQQIGLEDMNKVKIVSVQSWWKL